MTEAIQAYSRDFVTCPPALAALLTEKDLAAMAQVSPALLQKLRREGGGPAFVRIGTAVRYPANAVGAWLEVLHAAN